MNFVSDAKDLLDSILRKTVMLAVIAAMGALSACNSGSLTEGLQSAQNPTPSRSVAGAQPQPSPPGQMSTMTTNQQTAGLSPSPMASASSAPVAFLPVSNAPQTAVTTLARSIRNAAEQNALAVVPSVQQGAQYQVKGYFSALEDGSGTLLVYVWDVLDRNNKRVYRINGQEQINRSAADPWSAVTPAMLENVAAATVTQLKSWLATRGQAG